MKAKEFINVNIKLLGVKSKALGFIIGGVIFIGTRWAFGAQANEMKLPSGFQISKICKKAIEKAKIHSEASVRSQIPDLGSQTYTEWVHSPGVVAYDSPFGFNGEFSNAFPASVPLVINAYSPALIARTLEHYYHSFKFKGTEFQDEILSLTDPRDVVARGRDQNLPLRQDWNKVHVSIMFEGLLRKFRTHFQLAQELMKSKGRYLVYHNKKDLVWGDGKNGLGRNLHGQLLMVVRDFLLVENEAYRIKLKYLMSLPSVPMEHHNLDRPDLFLRSISRSVYFSPDQKELIDEISMKVRNELIDFVERELEDHLFNQRFDAVEASLYILSPFSSSSLSGSKASPQIKRALKRALVASVQYYQPKLLGRLLENYYLDSGDLDSPMVENGLTLKEYALALGHEDLFRQITAEIPDPNLVERKDHTKPLRLSFSFMKPQGGQIDGAVSNGLITEEIYSEIMSPSVAVSETRLNVDDVVIREPSGKLTRKRLNRPYLATLKEWQEFLLQIQILANGSSKKAKNLVKLIDPDRDKYGRVFYKPISVEQFKVLTSLAHLGNGLPLEDAMINGRRFIGMGMELRSMILDLEGRGRGAADMSMKAPVLVSVIDGGSFPVPYYGMLGVPTLCLKNQGFSVLAETTSSLSLQGPSSDQNPISSLSFKEESLSTSEGHTQQKRMALRLVRYEIN